MQALSQLSYTPKQRRHYSNQNRMRKLFLSTNNSKNHNTLAEWTGLEPATPGVTGRYSNQLNYHSAPNPTPDFSPKL